MTIARVEFIGFTVTGPSYRSFSFYKASDWPRWTCVVEGPSLIFEGEDGRNGRRRIEVPRALCVVHYDAAAKAEEPRLEAADMAARMAAVRAAKGKGSAA